MTCYIPDITEKIPTLLLSPVIPSLTHTIAPFLSLFLFYNFLICPIDGTRTPGRAKLSVWKQNWSPFQPTNFCWIYLFCSNSRGETRVEQDKVLSHQLISVRYYLPRYKTGKHPARQQWTYCTHRFWAFKGLQLWNTGMSVSQQPTESSKRPIRARYLSHVIGYQPIRDQYFLIRSAPAVSPFTN